MQDAEGDCHETWRCGMADVKHIKTRKVTDEERRFIEKHGDEPTQRAG